ncbi:MAG: protein-tyrosine phosphatase family protein [Rhodospirillales bacterium]
MNTTYPYCGALLIDQIESPTGTVFGMVHMPGRNHVDAKGRVWRRNLAEDLDRIEAWGATGMVTLVEDPEFRKLGVPGFADAVTTRRFGWFHMPIPDMQTPGSAFCEAWSRQSADFCKTARGGRIVVHCAGGLGRTGMFIAKLLVEAGSLPLDAIKTVRHARPGAIETLEQEEFILSGRSLGT